MPERRGSAETNPNTLSIFAFKPRQVLLAEQRSKNSSKHNSMAKNQAENKAEKEPDQKSLLHYSMALWLENCGFSATLKRFLSEAQIKDDDWKAKALDLKDMVSKYLETRNEVHTNVDPRKNQELQADSIVEKNGHDNSTASEENVGKKKKSKNKDNDPAVLGSGKTSEEVQPHDKVTESNAKAKKEKNKKTADTLVQSDHELLVSKKVTDGAVHETPVNESIMKEKEKKKRKSKLTSEALNGDEKQVETIPTATEEKTKDLNDSKDDSVPLVESKSKDKKKKKKLKNDGRLEDGEEDSLRNKSEVEETDKVVSKTELEEGKVQNKEKKRKKEAKVKSSSSDAEVLDKKDSVPDKSEKKLDETLEDGANGNKTAPKKRKRVDHDEEGKEPVEDSAVEESKRRKIDGEVETKGVDRQANDSLNNGGVEKNSELKSSRKQRNGSAEPKTVNAFQRVKVEEVKFVDERLQDNSYWAKDGADIGYGAKAQEVLGQVRGRDFRHEKTKKKRGSYRGGPIDLQSRSVKFNYSDEE